MKSFKKIFEELVDEEIQSKREAEKEEIRAEQQAEREELRLSIAAGKIIARKHEFQLTQKVAAGIQKYKEQQNSRLSILVIVKLQSKFAEIERVIQEVRNQALTNPDIESLMICGFLMKGFLVRNLSDVENVMKDGAHREVKAWLQEQRDKDPFAQPTNLLREDNTFYLPK